MRISPSDDLELIQRAQDGDREAFGALVLRYAPMVRRVTRAVLGHPADADDAAQDAMLAAWTALRRFDPAQPLGPWLTRIAMNAARDLRRRRRIRETEAIPRGVVGLEPGPDTATERALLRERLEAELAALPERRRLALVLYEVEGYAQAEIADLLGVPEGTVRSDIFHARRQLRTALGHPEAE